MTALLDSGVIASGDGALLGGALVALVVACFAVPLGFVVAWSLFRGFVEGEPEDYE